MPCLRWMHMGVGCVQDAWVCCNYVHITSIHSLPRSYRGIRWRNAVVARNAAHIFPPRNLPYPGSWRFLCNMICRHLFPPLSRWSRRIRPFSKRIWGRQSTDGLFLMVFEMIRSLLGLKDPKVDIWGKLAAGMDSIKDLGKPAIRIYSWEWVIDRCARCGQHLTCLSLGGWYPDQSRERIWV